MKIKLFYSLLVILIASSWKNNDVFFQYEPIPEGGWSKDSFCHFRPQITDTTVLYNTYIHIRNRGEYPYQNIWLFLEKTLPGKNVINDTIECYLADQRGKWLGSSVGAVFEMPVLIEQNVHFNSVGVYDVKIRQGMREDNLIGVSDIGFRVERIDKR